MRTTTRTLCGMTLVALLLGGAPRPAAADAAPGFETSLPSVWSSADRRILRDHANATFRLEIPGAPKASSSTTYGTLRWTPDAVRPDGHVEAASVWVSPWARDDGDSSRDASLEGTKLRWTGKEGATAEFAPVGGSTPSPAGAEWIRGALADRPWPELTSRMRIFHERSAQVGETWSEPAEEAAKVLQLEGRLDPARPAACTATLVSADDQMRRVDFRIDLPLARIPTSDGEAVSRGDLALRATGGRIVRRSGGATVWHSWLDMGISGRATMGTTEVVVIATASRVTWTMADTADHDAAAASGATPPAVPEAVRALGSAVFGIEGDLRGALGSRMGGTAFRTSAGHFVTAARLLSDLEAPKVVGSGGAARPVTRVTRDASPFDLVEVGIDDADADGASLEIGPAPAVGARVWIPRRASDGSVAWTSGTVGAAPEVPSFGKALRITANVESGWNGAPVLDEKGHAVAVVSRLASWGDVWALPLEGRLGAAAGAGIPWAEWHPALRRGPPPTAEQATQLKTASDALTQGRPEVASDVVTKLGLVGIDAAAWWRAITAAFVSQGRFDEAVAAHQHEIQQAPYFATLAFEEAWAQVHRAELFRAWGRMDAAAGAYERALSAMPDLASARQGYEEARAALGVR